MNRYQVSAVDSSRLSCWRDSERDAVVAAHAHLGERHPHMVIEEFTGVSGTFGVRHIHLDGRDSGWRRWVAGRFVGSGELVAS